jgi:hypothetical protein
MGVTAGIFLTSILLKEMRYLVYIRYLWSIYVGLTNLFLYNVHVKLTVWLFLFHCRSYKDFSPRNLVRTLLLDRPNQ